MIHNTYSPWAELTSLPDLTLEWKHLAQRRLGEYIHPLRLIRLDPRMPRRQARSVLCHELAHAKAGDELTACERLNMRQEVAADKAASRLLIDIRDLADAMAVHERHLSAVAVDLRVSQAILAVRLKHLHPAERHFLTDYLGERS